MPSYMVLTLMCCSITHASKGEPQIVYTALGDLIILEKWSEKWKLIERIFNVFPWDKRWAPWICCLFIVYFLCIVLFSRKHDHRSSGHLNPNTKHTLSPDVALLLSLLHLNRWGLWPENAIICLVMDLYHCSCNVIPALFAPTTHANHKKPTIFKFISTKTVFRSLYKEPSNNTQTCTPNCRRVGSRRILGNVVN